MVKIAHFYSPILTHRLTAPFLERLCPLPLIFIYRLLSHWPFAFTLGCLLLAGLLFYDRKAKTKVASKATPRMIAKVMATTGSTAAEVMAKAMVPPTAAEVSTTAEAYDRYHILSLDGLAKTEAASRPMAKVMIVAASTAMEVVAKARQHASQSCTMATAMALVTTTTATTTTAMATV